MSASGRFAISDDQRTVAKMVRLALTSRDVPLADVAVAIGVTQQRVSRLLDGERSFPLHILVTLARTGGPRGREVVSGVIDQLRTYVDAHTVVHTDGSLLTRIAEISRAVGEFSAAVLDPNTELEMLHKKMTDVKRVADETLRQIEARLERGQR